MNSGLERRARRIVRRFACLREALTDGFSETFQERRPGAGVASQRVVVVGAGLAGLATAYRLLKRGHDVTILEARSGPGGRILTLREPFAAGLSADAGGFRFRDDHWLVKRYVKLFNLPIAPFYPLHGTSIAFFAGDRIYRESRRPTAMRFSRPLTALEKWQFAQENDFQTFKIRGGADTLPGAFADRLGGRISFGSVVTGMEHDSQKVRVTFERDGSQQTIDADRLVCALPFSSLRRVSIRPALSPEKQRVVSDLTYAPGCLIYHQVRTDFLRQKGLTGFAVTDTIGEVWHLTHDQEGERGIIVAYVRGELVQQFARLDERARASEALRRMETILPGITANTETSASVCWDEDEWSRGAQSMIWALDKQSRPIIRRPEGRVHFAGEHAASRHHGWMEGALESAHRVAHEVETSPPRT